MQLEFLVVIVALASIAWAAYKFLLPSVSEERHRLFRTLFGSSLWNIIATSVFFLLFFLSHRFLTPTAIHERIAAYIGFFTIILGCISFIKVLRIMLFEYLFLGHMRVGVPLLLVNLFTLLISFLLCSWLASEIFSVNVGPLLVTSAAFSIVIGLALQDTLGNLFAGIAMQFDKPFEIGDWIEILQSGQKTVGRVDEISWRATLLTGLSDEIITLPNRTMSQAQISNYSGKLNPIVRTLIFRFDYNAPIEKIKSQLVQAALKSPGVAKEPQPIAIVAEVTDSLLAMKLVFSISNYGSQFLIADHVLHSALELLTKENLTPASPRLRMSISR